MLDSFTAMDGQGTADARARRLTAAILARQSAGPVHTWRLVEPNEGEDWRASYQTVGQFMSTDLFTVQPDDLIDLVASVMDWRHVRHVPVEDEAGHLVGLITHRSLLRMLSNGVRTGGTVREIMVAEPITISPSTPSVEAIEIMRQNRIGCLPVVEGNQLVGIVTSYDFLEASARLFEQHITSHNEAQKSQTPQ